jgi:pimeloyl-ACP methyl ester carboxylesterase
MQFAEGIAGARLAVLHDCGHLSNLEQPERFNDAVREHCRAHPVAGPANGVSLGP